LEEAAVRKAVEGVAAARCSGRTLYYISILGTPSGKEPVDLAVWRAHLALNITIAGEQGILTPTLTRRSARSLYG